jgi:hypothetical protein
MHAIRFAVALPALTLALALPHTSSVAGPEPAFINAPVGPSPSPTPMVAELLAAIEEQERQLDEVRREIGMTWNQSRRLELERRIETIKRDTELQILQIQATHARQDGRLEVAEELEAVIAKITAPLQRQEPAPRPAPSSVHSN